MRRNAGTRGVDNSSAVLENRPEMRGDVQPGGRHPRPQRVPEGVAEARL